MQATATVAYVQQADSIEWPINDSSATEMPTQQGPARTALSFDQPHTNPTQFYAREHGPIDRSIRARFCLAARVCT